MRISKAWWAVPAAALALALGVRVAHHFSAGSPLRPGQRLVPLSLSTLAGSPVSFGPSGRPQLINVFATWCPPCRMETPELAALAERLRKRGVGVVGIDQAESSLQVERYRDRFSLHYPLYIDTGTATHDVLGARVIPETLFVGADGVIRWIRVGPLSSQDVDRIGLTGGRAV